LSQVNCFNILEHAIGPMVDRSITMIISIPGIPGIPGTGSITFPRGPCKPIFMISY